MKGLFCDTVRDRCSEGGEGKEEMNKEGKEEERERVRGRQSREAAARPFYYVHHATRGRPITMRPLPVY